MGKASAFAARDCALRVLEAAGGPLPVQALLDRALNQARLSPPDAALATELVYGTLRCEIRLDFLLGLLLRDPAKLPPRLRDLLRLSAYELGHLDRIPAHATVHNAVEAARCRFGPGLGKLVNGVLRRLPEQLAAATDPAFFAAHAPDAAKDPDAALALRASLPRWIVRLWRESYGEDKAVSLALASTVAPWGTLRLNAARPDVDALARFFLEAGAQAVGRHGFTLPPGVQTPELRTRIQTLHREGRLSRQGAGSLHALEALGLETWDEPVWDACAGRGGKTLALLEQGVPLLAASDVHTGRLRGLAEDAARLGLACPPRFLASAAHPPLRGRPSRILLDAPCSGLGTLARRPDLRRTACPARLP